MFALEQVLQEQAEKLDPTVAEYLNNVIQEYVQSACIDGEPATVETLFESCGDFLQDCDVTQQGFQAAVERLCAGKENTTSTTCDEAGAPHNQNVQQADAAEKDAGCLKENDNQHCRSLSGREKVHATGNTAQPRNGSKNKKQTQSEPSRAISANKAKTGLQDERKPAEEDASRTIKQEDTGLQAVCGSLDATVKELFHAAKLPEPDVTVQEYILSVVADFVAEFPEEGSADEEETEEIREAILGVAPEMAPFVAQAPFFSFFLGRVRALSLEAAQKQQQEAAAQRRPAAASPRGSAAGRRRGEEEEQQERAAAAAAAAAASRRKREEELLAGSQSLLVLRDLFPETDLGELRMRLEVAGGNLEEAIERTVEGIEFAEGLVSSEELQAQRAAFEQEAKEALRERALKYYSQVKESDKGETGKPVDVRAALHRSADFDRSVQESLSADKQRLRYINNEVVSHKGERFIMEKTKNAVPEDPKSFIGLKIKSKKKGGPSPNFK